MGMFLIGYDLSRPGQDYATLSDAIKNLSDGNWWHHLDSTWIIRSNYNVVVLRDLLLPHIDRNDELLVVELKPGLWASYGFNASGANWLSQVLG